jgi:hypothetical protein
VVKYRKQEGQKTKGVVEYELLVKHPCTYTEEDIAFEVYAVLHDIPNSWEEYAAWHLGVGRSRYLWAPRISLGAASVAAIGSNPCS